MINLYTTFINEDTRFVLNNDAYFNIVTSTQKFDEVDRALIHTIDRAELLPDLRIRSTFGYGNIIDLSSGCKTVLNIKKNMNKIFCIDECGPNALDKVFELDNISVCMTFPQNFKMASSCRIRFNDDDEIVAKNQSEFVSIWREIRAK